MGLFEPAGKFALPFYENTVVNKALRERTRRQAVTEDTKTSWWGRRSRASRIGLVVLGVFVALLVVLWVALPSIIGALLRRQLPAIEERLGAEVEFEDVEVHGLTGLDIRGIVILDDAGEPLLEIERLEMRLAANPLFNPIEPESIHLVSPAARIVRNAEGVTNFDRIREQISENEDVDERPFEGRPVIQITDGSLVFEDATPEGEMRFEGARDLDLVMTPTGEQGGTLEASVDLSFHFKGTPSRTERLELNGHLDDNTGFAVEASVPSGLVLPLDGSMLIPGFRLHGVSLAMGAPEGDEMPAPMEGGMVGLRYSLGDLTWTSSYPMLSTEWVELVVHGRLPAPPLPEAESIDAYVGPGVEPWTHGVGSTSRPVVLEDMKPALSQAESYFERYDFEVETPDGTFALDAEMTVSNFGLGTHKGAIRGHIQLGDEKVEFFERFPQGDWSAEVQSEAFTLTFGDWSASGVPGKVSFAGQAGKGEEVVTYRFAFSGVSWLPGRGLSLFGNGEQGSFVEDVVVVAGQAEGSYTRGGQETPVTGTGYVHRVGTNVGTQGFFERIYRFHQVDGPLFVEWKRLQPSPALDHPPIDYFVVFYEGQRVFESYEVEVTSGEPYKDEENYGYVVHKRMDLSARNAAGQTAKLALSAENIDIFNPLSQLSSFQRSMAEKMARPTNFTLRSAWGLKLPEGLGVPTEHRGKCETSCFVMR